jgi:hypothetical protein
VSCSSGDRSCGEPQRSAIPMGTLEERRKLLGLHKLVRWNRVSICQGIDPRGPRFSSGEQACEASRRRTVDALEQSLERGGKGSAFERSLKAELLVVPLVVGIRHSRRKPGGGARSHNEQGPSRLAFILSHFVGFLSDLFAFPRLV